jgi:hypothetical protein
MDPTYPSANWLLMEVYAQREQWPQSCQQFQKIFVQVENRSLPPAWVGAHPQCSKQEYWKKRIEMQLDTVKDVSDYSGLAIAYARSGQSTKALDALDLAVKKNNLGLKYLRVDPGFDSLRDEPRFQELVRKMNFPPDEHRKPSA